MSKQFRVLIVDDSSFSRNHLSDLVKKAGHIVVEAASSGAEAILFLERNPVDVVITDIVMPEMTGIQLTERINREFGHIEVIVVSSLSQEHVILDAITAGASDFIPKPVTQDQMNHSLFKINKIINNNL